MKISGLIYKATKTIRNNINRGIIIGNPNKNHFMLEIVRV